jgi:hypothetical protein
MGHDRWTKLFDGVRKGVMADIMEERRCSQRAGILDVNFLTTTNLH